MRPDFSRGVFNPIRRFTGVRLQQGEVKMDADQPAVTCAGVFRGVARDVDDPEQRLRVLVSVPDVLGGQALWAEACVPPGSRTIPAVDQQVWVMFERGDPGYPVWLGVGGAAP